jgi:hypothetical protein
MAISSIGSSALSALTLGNQTPSRSELAQKMLNAMDTDQNGSVSKEEFVAFGEKVSTQSPATQRANATKPLSGTNAPAPPSADKLFAAADQNGDQSLSVDELSSMLAEAETHARAAQGNADVQGGSGGPTAMGGRPGGAPPPGMGGAPGGMGGAAASKSGSSSADSDGTGSSSSSTDPADTNEDGVVSAAEKSIYELTHPSSGSSSSSTEGLPETSANAR